MLFQFWEHLTDRPFIFFSHISFGPTAPAERPIEPNSTSRTPLLAILSNHTESCRYSTDSGFTGTFSCSLPAEPKWRAPASLLHNFPSTIFLHFWKIEQPAAESKPQSRGCAESAFRRRGVTTRPDMWRSSGLRKTGEVRGCICRRTSGWRWVRREVLIDSPQTFHREVTKLRDTMWCEKWKWRYCDRRLERKTNSEHKKMIPFHWLTSSNTQVQLTLHVVQYCRPCSPLDNDTNFWPYSDLWTGHGRLWPFAMPTRGNSKRWPKIFQKLGTIWLFTSGTTAATHEKLSPERARHFSPLATEPQNLALIAYIAFNHQTIRRGQHVLMIRREVRRRNPLRPKTVKTAAATVTPIGMLSATVTPNRCSFINRCKFL